MCIGTSGFAKEYRLRTDDRYATSETPRARVEVSLGVDPRRFRFAGEEEAAGGAVAVIHVGIMEIEWYSVGRCVSLCAMFFAADDGKG